MTQQQLVKWGEIKNKEGETVFTLWLNNNEAKLNSSTKQTQGNDEKPSKENASENNEPMTYAQKRYLFRLLADQGLQGDSAYTHLKKTFGVEYLKNVSKSEASRIIDQLLKSVDREVKNGTEKQYL